MKIIGKLFGKRDHHLGMIEIHPRPETRTLEEIQIDYEKVLGLTAIAVLPCGARLCRFDNNESFYFNERGPFALKRYALRQGEAGLYCVQDCLAFHHCPLVKIYLERWIDGKTDRFGEIIANYLKAEKLHAAPADVGDPDGAAPADAAEDVKVRYIAFRDGTGKKHLVVAPMSPEMEHCGSSGNASQHRADVE